LKQSDKEKEKEKEKDRKERERKERAQKEKESGGKGGEMNWEAQRKEEEEPLSGSGGSGGGGAARATEPTAPGSPLGNANDIFNEFHLRLLMKKSSYFLSISILFKNNLFNLFYIYLNSIVYLSERWLKFSTSLFITLNQCCPELK
jgi:hypothetical protein